MDDVSVCEMAALLAAWAAGLAGYCLGLLRGALARAALKRRLAEAKGDRDEQAARRAEAQARLWALEQGQGRGRG